MTYRIWCQVSGGVTGDRSAWLKHDDKIVEFDSFDEAKAEAKALTDRANNPQSFLYTVQEYRVSELKSHA